jgi:3-hydroxyacyl-[acyl-carrier-protein] dehydratase
LLLNDLYTIQSISGSDNIITAFVQLREDHDIFKGHFPGQPVLPGVCMMEMVTEIAGLHLNKSFRISAAPMIKFLHVIDPRKNSIINLEIKYQSSPHEVNSSGKIFFGSETFMKFQINLRTDRQ